MDRFHPHNHLDEEIERAAAQVLDLQRISDKNLLRQIASINRVRPTVRGALKRNGLAEWEGHTFRLTSYGVELLGELMEEKTK